MLTHKVEFDLTLMELLQILKKGMQVLLHNDDSLKTVGQLNYSNEENIWVAKINWDTLK